MIAGTVNGSGGESSTVIGTASPRGKVAIVPAASPSSDGETRRANKKLTHRNHFLLCTELVHRKKELEESRMTNREACKLLSAALGFEITESNLEHAKKASGIQWKISRSGAMPGSKTVANRARLALARQVASICAQLGLPLDKDVQFILDHFDDKGGYKASLS